MNFNPMLTLTYNRTVERVRDIHITPTGLESTCLMFAHGMGAFYYCHLRFLLTDYTSRRLIRVLIQYSLRNDIRNY